MLTRRCTTFPRRSDVEDYYYYYYYNNYYYYYYYCFY